ncbi:hypothetical protein Tco_0726106 [Tanacetum coccineum]|uniref:Uncharacterized protein n=1 Tax=Tanacetum coccineum TaxID=301880 RepID=A0ABQ4YGZ0_9ASTR
MTPPPGLSTLTPLPGPNVSELPPITAFTFTARTPENTPLTNWVSTSKNPDPMIIPAFVEANYEREKWSPDPRKSEKLHQIRKQRLRGFEDRRKELLSSKMLQTGKGEGLKGMKNEEGM